MSQDQPERSGETDASGGASRMPALLRRLHEDESAVAATEYIIVFTLVTFGSTIAMLVTLTYIKANRDFTLWWFAHPAV